MTSHATKARTTRSARPVLESASLVAQPATSAVGLPQDDAAAVLGTELMQLLLFRLGDDWYAVPLAQVREVHGECLASPLPCVPDFVLGVVSLRGEIVSVSDLGRMSHLTDCAAKHGRAPAVVVENDESTTAIVVDELGDIAQIELGNIEPLVSTIDRYQAAFLLGSAEVGNRMVGLLNVDRVLEPIGDKPRH
jgi:purine-binding chemotaxis protein CheW